MTRVCHHFMSMESVQSTKESNLMKTKLFKVKVTNNIFFKIEVCKILSKDKRLKSEYKLALGKTVKHTRFQGHDTIKVKDRHDLKMILTVKLVEHSCVIFWSR